VVQIIKEAFDISVQYPVDLSAGYSYVQRIQGIMLAPVFTEPVAEIYKIRFIYLV